MKKLLFFDSMDRLDELKKDRAYVLQRMCFSLSGLVLQHPLATAIRTSSKPSTL